MSGYIRGHYIVSDAGRILATIVKDTDSCAYGELCRRYVRAVDDAGNAWSGSCPADCDHVQLRQVKSQPVDVFVSPLLREYVGRVAS